jgi:hypothetical protein
MSLKFPHILFLKYAEEDAKKVLTRSLAGRIRIVVNETKDITTCKMFLDNVMFATLKGNDREKIIKSLYETTLKQIFERGLCLPLIKNRLFSRTIHLNINKYSHLKLILEPRLKEVHIKYDRFHVSYHPCLKSEVQVLFKKYNIKEDNELLMPKNHFVASPQKIDYDAIIRRLVRGHSVPGYYIAVQTSELPSSFQKIFV